MGETPPGLGVHAEFKTLNSRHLFVSYDPESHDRSLFVVQ